ncbi:hypothetical protein RRG08_050855 [Elysia crispata]|uniref:Uncharacterized protein n=1 Tax=Elysia crispata TaxID=231223 RepID=A0AAE0ZD87_9GAST|nr:hypothetical protein RRG08_050855 [Elysia crispata]
MNFPSSSPAVTNSSAPERGSSPSPDQPSPAHSHPPGPRHHERPVSERTGIYLPRTFAVGFVYFFRKTY